jgi:hypothetical protein
MLSLAENEPEEVAAAYTILKIGVECGLTVLTAKGYVDHCIMMTIVGIN